MSQGPSWTESILRLRAGDHAPAGCEIKRVIGTVREPSGTGTNWQEVYVVAIRREHAPADGEGSR